MPTENPNVGIAMALVAGAGAATALGAAVVFVPSLVQYANRKTLASALGLSAGVMTYVSFVEIFRKSVDSFRVDGIPDDDAYVYSTLCFFGGVVFMVTLNYSVTKLIRGDHHHHHDPVEIARTTKSISQLSNSAMAGPEPTSAAAATSAIDEGNTISPCACCADDPVADLEAMQSMANELQRPPTNPVGRNSEAQELSLIQRDTTLQPNATTGSGVEASDDGGNVDGSSSSGSGDEEAEAIKRKEDEAKLMRMSINTAIAIGLHNFPEGLATFVAALHDPKVGAVLALAIAIHNVPEGLCVALPIYYATGKRWKAFGLAVCSGASEPVAALLGWAVLANSFSNTMYAVLFGLVAGMMVIISVRELLPTAHRYDPDDSVVTYSYIVGMCIMALSLVLFVL